MDQGGVWRNDRGVMTEDIRSLFEKHRDGLPELACASLSYARENAVLSLESIGLPSNRLESGSTLVSGRYLKDLKLTYKVQVDSRMKRCLHSKNLILRFYH